MMLDLTIYLTNRMEHRIQLHIRKYEYLTNIRGPSLYYVKTKWVDGITKTLLSPYNLPHNKTYSNKLPQFYSFTFF